MKKYVWVVIAIALTGCSTIQSPSIAYLGDYDSSTGEVLGTSSHGDLAGMGVDDASLALDYQHAIDNALVKAPEGTIGLSNIKAFYKRNITPQIIGGFVYSLGMSMAISGEDNVLSLATMGAGLFSLFINSYTVSVIATPITP